MRAVLQGGLLLFTLANNVLAHRLDEYLQATRISVATNRVDLSIDLTPGVAIADKLLVIVDKDGDGRVSNEEGVAYAKRVLKDLKLGLDEQVLTLNLVDTSFPTFVEIRGGVGVIQIKAMATVGPLTPGKHTLSLTNAHLPAISVYLVNALIPKDNAISITKQNRDELQRDYRLEFEIIASRP